MTMRTVVAASAAAGLFPLVLVGILGSTRVANAPNPPDAPFDVQSYRREGQAGVDRFFKEHEVEITRGDADTVRAFDQICGQFDCARTRLFWNTDLEAAKAQARREHKPILSLHLLGRFDEQLTCANSRFFRRLLYPDPRINAALREKYVLHWQTVRAVPKITIDFGDGRTMQRTITGNSAHYVLDEDGRPLDVIPGLYSPQPFLTAITDAAALHRSLAGTTGEARIAKVEAWHAAKLRAGMKAWDGAMKAAAITAPAYVKPTDPYAVFNYDTTMKDEDWKKLAAANAPHDEVAFDPGVTRALTEKAKFDAWDSGQIAMTKAMVENPMLRATRRLESTVHLDSVRNELSLHNRAHFWFAKQQVARTGDLKSLNERVYRELFLAPLDDPWYGLGVPPEMQELDGTITTASAALAR